MREFLRIVYCSRNRVIGTRQEIEVQIRNILATSRTNNAAAGVTGALTFNDGCFAQVLEGYADALRPIFDRIRRDDRHSDIKFLSSTKPVSRLFPKWSMAYVNMPYDDGRHPMANFAFEAALTQGAEPEAEQLLQAMRLLTRSMA